MRFETPWLLLGLLGAAIPLVIHLINRQRARLRRFAALEYLLLSDKRLAQRLRLRQILVLLLRMLLVAAIPFALAKPYLQSSPSSVGDLSDPGAVVLVIDDSMSMSAVDPSGETALERAVDVARDSIRSGGARTRFAVVMAGRSARLITPGFSYEHDVLERALDTVTPGSRSGDMGAALREAEALLADTTDASRRVLVIGDQAAHAWASVTEPWALAEPPRVQLVDIPTEGAANNAAITGVRVRPAPEVGPEQVRVEVDITNHGSSAMKRRLRVSLGGSPVVSQVDLAPNAAYTAVSLHRLVGDSLDAPGEAQLMDEDVLPGDDTWYFTLRQGGALRVLVVNGSPRSVSHLDEVYFLRAALAAETGDRIAFDVDVVGPEDLEASRLAHTDVLVLANVGPLLRSRQTTVRHFVESGGGLLVTAGDQLGSEAAATYGELLPLPVRDIKEVAKRSDPGSQLTALRLSSLDFDHPALSEFAHVQDVSLLKARTYTHVLVDTGRRDDSRVIASFTGGRPALVEGKVGRGRTLFFTTSLDRDWSDLVVRTSFVPLVHQLVLYLAGALESEEIATWTPGDRVVTAAPGGLGPLALERPDGAEVSLEVEQGEEMEQLTLDGIDIVGHYTVRRRGREGERITFAVNASRDESLSGLVARDRVEEMLLTPGSGSQPTAVAASRTSTQEEDPHRTRLWPFVLLSLFGLLLSEAWMVLRG